MNYPIRRQFSIIYNIFSKYVKFEYETQDAYVALVIIFLSKIFLHAKNIIAIQTYL